MAGVGPWGMLKQSPWEYWHMAIDARPTGTIGARSTANGVGPWRGARAATAAVVAAVAALAGPVSAQVIRPEQASVGVFPGMSVSVRWLLEGLTTPTVGYSLDIDLISGPATSTVRVDADLSNFAPDRNVLVAAGHDLDPRFSIITSDGSGGAFITAISADLGSAVPTAGVNDALAEVVIEADMLAAAGDYVFALGPGSAVSDAQGFPIALTPMPLVVRVAPAPATLGLAPLAMLAARRRRFAHC